MYESKTDNIWATLMLTSAITLSVFMYASLFLRTDNYIFDSTMGGYHSLVKAETISAYPYE